MADTLRVKRRAAGGAAGPPAALAAAEIAFNEQDNTLYYGSGNSAGAATSIFPIAGPGAFLRLSGGILTGGVSWTTALDSSAGSTAAHLTLHTAGFGFGITAGRLNYVAPAGNAHVFLAGAVDKVTINTSGVTMASGTAVTLAADPTTALQAATKQYVDTGLAASVVSFNSRIGAVTLTTADITGAGGAPLASPSFTGTPLAPTAAPGTNTTQLATTGFVAAAAALYVPLATGGTVSGNLTVSGATISVIGTSPSGWGMILSNTATNGIILNGTYTAGAIRLSTNMAIAFTQTGVRNLYFDNVNNLPAGLKYSTGSVATPNPVITLADAGYVQALSFYADGATGAFRSFRATTSGILNWIVGGNQTATPLDGSNAGTDLDFNAYSDTGTLIATAVRIWRSTGLAQFYRGIQINTLAAPGGVTDLSRHIALFSTTYGVNVTANRLNYVAPNLAAHTFVVNAVDKVTINTSGITMAAATAITLAADPTTALHACSKQYVDARAGPILATIAALRAATAATLGIGQCVVQSFAGTTNKGGGTFIYVSTDTTSADNTGTVIVDASGRRWYRLGRADDLCSVHWWGAVGDGATNDAAPLNAAFASGLSLYMPAGTYNVTGPLTCACIGQRIEGSGEMVTTISTNQATGDVLTLTGSDIDIGSIGFTATVARTAGAMINLGNTSQVRLHDFYMTAFFVGVSIGVLGSGGGNTVYVERGILLTTVASGYGVQVNSGVVLVLRDLLIEGNNATQSVQLTAGVVVFGVGDLTLDHVSTIWAGHGLEVPLNAANAVCQALWVINCFFDTGSGYGIYVNAAGASSNVQEIKIADCWIASNALGGIALTTSSTGVIQQCDVLDTVSSNNTGHGISITGARVANTRILGCSIGSNTAYSGVWIDANVSYFQVIGNWLGASGEFLGNAAGITINNNCDHFTVSDNIFNGNATTFNMGTFSGIPGVSFWISHNHGIITRYFGAMVTTAGPSAFTVTHGLAWTPLLPNIRLTLGSGLGAAKYFYPTNVTATTFQIAFDVAPGAGVTVNWEASVLGG
jgi:Right handed beta helix region